eukprot:Skav216414  [mRNA]  locus=scaffold457:564102:564311:+ [translate_table: standard]
MSDLSEHRWTSTATVQVSTAGPQLPMADRRAPLDLNGQRRISVSTAGPQRPTSDLSEHRWTSTANVRSQ